MRTLACFFIFLLSLCRGDSPIPAFPGAEGFGCNTPGGRGGETLLVTNLNDSGPGSFRTACQASGPRVVLFGVSGIIELSSPINIREPFITIAGQSAPGDGICLKRFGLSVSAHDVVIRHLRSRPGDISGKEVDAISVGGNSHHVVLDHCSASWAVDENLSPSGGISDVTVQWCLIGESLNQSVHSKGAHGYGSLVRAAGGVSLHHNLWAHNSGRNPRLGDNYARPPFPLLDVRNNAMYNYVGLSVVGDILRVNYVSNFLKPGPSSRSGLLSPTDTAQAQFFMSGNVVAGRPESAVRPESLFARLEFGGKKLVAFVSAPFEAAAVRTLPAAEVWPLILDGAGATAPRRDPVDRRIVNDARNGTGTIIDSQRQVGGWPEYRQSSPPLDTDQDGLPDEWEKDHGLDPNNKADARLDRDGDGYTNLEEYINSLAISRSTDPR